MRKTSYGLTFLAVVLIFVLHILSVLSADWYYAKILVIGGAEMSVRYGLRESCVKQDIFESSYECRQFPDRSEDKCANNRRFCTEWSTAAYLSEIALWFTGLTVLAIMFGVSTHSRRRRIWKAVAGFILFDAVLQLVTFSMITDLYRTSDFPPFDYAKPSTGYYLNVATWVIGMFAFLGVLTTGLAAGKGQRWAIGNRDYQPIHG